MIEEEIKAFCEIYKNNLFIQNKIFYANSTLLRKIENLLRKKFPEKIDKIEIFGIKMFPYSKVNLIITENTYNGFTLEELTWIEENTGFRYKNGTDGGYIFTFNISIASIEDLKSLEGLLNQIHEVCNEWKKNYLLE